MHTKQDFLNVIESTVAQYPSVAALYQAGDPRILQAQSAMAQMLAMLSQQMEIGMMEPFSKTRDATVLADAALKGLVPMSLPSRVRVKVSNSSSSPYQLNSGRALIDSSGNLYEVDLPVTVPPGSDGFAELVQAQTRTFDHTVSVSMPFYKVEVPASTDGKTICGIRLKDSGGTEYRYSREFTNVASGDAVFNIECDEYRKIFIVLGYDQVIGHQPKAGDVYSVLVRETSGEIQVPSGSPFSLQYSYTPQDAQIKISMDALLVAGANPMDVPTLRELCKYPAAYDSSAVFLGEFDFLIRRNVPNLRFLSVWNESVEESVRGANVSNINTLFISFLEPIGSSRAAIQEMIRNVVIDADDSFKVAFVAPVISNVVATVNASVARVNDTESVRQSIRDVLLAEYGASSPAVRIGMSMPMYKRVYELLREKVPALQDNGADFTVNIAPIAGAQLPEQFRFMTADSLTINVTRANYNLNGWGM
ncbi:hypothetical protein [Undibacterium crateris]|uniref:hypothetical protein n=1 Tax=Undibacterium crateris TaxID=2528175 RepID=UPI0013893DA6|nr:hypothetical protein [Undibacterium crateris]NDI85087.1 hypothetical protein [Undibacterium crateris]